VLNLSNSRAHRYHFTQLSLSVWASVLAWVGSLMFSVSVRLIKTALALAK